MVEFVAGFPDIPSDPAVVVLNPDDEVTPESFTVWLDRRQAGKPVDPGCELQTRSPRYASPARCDPGRQAHDGVPGYQ